MVTFPRSTSDLARYLKLWTQDEGFYHTFQNDVESLHGRSGFFHTSVIFWPDLANYNYSKLVLELYTANKVEFVPKEINPPNCPEFRAIIQRYCVCEVE